MLASRIAALRRSAGMSQAELARKLRISPSAVGMYEQGRREPSADILVNMAQVFGVSTDFLLTGKAEHPPDQEALTAALLETLESAESRLAARRGETLSRQELAALLAALLMEA